MHVVSMRASRRGGFRALVWCGAVLLAACGPAVAASPDMLPQVVVLSSYHQGDSWTDRQVQGIFATLLDAHPDLTPSVEYLDAKRRTDAAHMELMKAFLAEKYHGRRLDVVVALDNPALDLLLESREDIFPGVPIVFAGINGFRPAMIEGRTGITGISEERDAVGTLELALRLHRRARRVFVIHDYTVSGLATRRSLEKELARFAGRVEVEFAPQAGLGEIEQQLRRLPRDALVLLLTYVTEPGGRALKREQVFLRIAAASPAPVFTVQEIPERSGIVGGMVVEGRDHGRQVAELALRVLGGEDPSAIPVARSRSRPFFDYAQLKRWGIPLRDLPPDSVVIGRPHSLWERSRTVAIPLLGAVGVLLIVAAMLVLAWLRLRRAHAAVQASEARYRCLVETANDGIMAMDSAFMVTFVNRRMADMAGCAPEEMIGRAAHEFFAEEELNDHWAQVEARRRGARGHYERRLRPRDGSERWALVSATPLWDAQGRFAGSFGMFSDITERKQAERRLREKERLLNAAQELARLGSWELDVATGRLTWSDEVYRIFGMTPQEAAVSYESFLAAVHPDDRAAVDAAYSASLRDGSDGYEIEHRVIARDTGEVRHVHEKCIHIRDLSGRVCRSLGMAHDITARRRAEAALRQSEERYRLLFEQMTSGFALHETDLDDPTQLGEYRYIAVNPAFERLVGLRAQDLIGKRARDTMPADEALWIEPYGPRVAAGEAVQFEIHSRVPDRYFQVHAFRPAPRQYAVMFDDITERKRAEEALRQSEERLKMVLEGGDLGAWDWEVLTGRITLNERYASMLGLTLDAFTPSIQWWKEQIHPDDLATVLTVLEDHLAGAAPQYEVEYRMRHADGRWVWILDRGRVIQRDAEGRPVRVSGTHLDITERKRLQEQYRQAQKMEAVGRLAAGVAHDFNNQLTVILGYCDMLLAERTPDDPLWGPLSEMYRAAQHAQATTSHLLSFSRKQILQPQKTDLNELLSSLHNPVSRLIGEDIRLSVITAPQLRPVLVDKASMHQAVMNLVINARDAMHQGGDLLLRTANLDLGAQGSAQFAAAPPGPYVLLEVRDTGVGMDDETLAHVFDPFFTTKGVGKGTGLGLAMVLGFVQQSHGFLAVESHPGQGTVFRILLPAVSSVPAALNPSLRSSLEAC